MNYNHTQGRIYADEMLDGGDVSGIERITCGLEKYDWKRETAVRLIKAADERLRDGLNPDYQRGVIERAREELV